MGIRRKGGDILVGIGRKGVEIQERKRDVENIYKYVYINF